MRNTSESQRVSTGIFALIAICLALLAVLTTAGCGDDSGDAGSAKASGNEFDAAFVEQMTAHHRGAIAMAKSAEKNATHDEIKQLAQEIVEAQQSEIAKMDRIGKSLKAAGVDTPTGGMGMSASAMGMDFEMPMLENADDFDKAFLDMMIPHHRGAILMSKRLIDSGSNEELLKLAKTIIDAQTAEIEKMQDWREEWYDARLPGSTDDGMMDHGAMDHGNMEMQSERSETR